MNDNFNYGYLNLLNEKDRLFSLLKKAYFPKVIVCSKWESYLKTIADKKCFVVASQTLFNLKKKELLEILPLTETDYFISTGEPKEETVEKLKHSINSKNYSFVIAFGGGSTIDLAKTIKREFNLPLVAIPTTPGTGSEASPYAVVITKNQEKKVLSGCGLVPDIVVLDPSLLRTIPPDIMKYCVVDMLSHSVESFCSKIASRLSDCFALEAFRIINTTINMYLENSLQQDDDFFAKVQIAGTLSGIAQSMAATGLAHSFAHYFGPRYNLAHGKALSIFLRDVISLNISNTPALNEKLRAQQISGSEELISAVNNIFRVFNIKDDKIMVQNSFDSMETSKIIIKDICTITNPFRPGEQQIKEIIEKHIVWN